MELTAAVSKINDFKQVRKLSIKSEQIILKDSDGNVVEVNTKRHREQISQDYRSKVKDFNFGFTYKTKVPPLPLPELSKAKFELAKRIFASVRCPQKEYNQKAQAIYDLHKQCYNQVSRSYTKTISDYFCNGPSNSGSDASNPNSGSDASNSNNAPNPELSLDPFILHLAEVSSEKKDEVIYEKAAVFRKFIVKSVESFYIALVSILVESFSGFASQFYHTFYFRLLKMKHAKPNYSIC
jgi:hypothetical protein